MPNLVNMRAAKKGRLSSMADATISFNAIHQTMNSFDSFTLAPMSAGDIIDRAARLYRRNFWALLRIVLGPSLVAYAGTVLYEIGIRNFSMMRGDGRVALSLLMAIGGICLLIVGKTAFYAVLGGASRSLVDHLFEGKPILARDVYRSIFKRFWSLVGALFMVLLLMAGATVIIYFVVAILILIGIFAATIFTGTPYWLQALLATGYGIFIGLIALMMAMLVYSRVVYVPQVMMVEDKGVFSSIGRSFSLAGKEVWRIAALLLFWLYVAWSVWSLLYFPLGSVAYWFGTSPNPFNQNNPFWFVIAYQALTPLSEILITPVAMLGLTLLYLDSRVRKEGFDVELLANRLMPPTPQMRQLPLAPQIASFERPVETISTSPFPSILGLNDYTPVHSPIGSIAVEPLPAPLVTIEPAANGAALPEESLEPTAANFAPAEVATPAIVPEAESAATQEQAAIEGKPAAPIVKAAIRTCIWCGTEASGEDRFCRVCGAVF
ncbi:MAG: hypothetical protein ABI977_04575 [Acidobacteriota bacterium]